MTAPEPTTGAAGGGYQEALMKALHTERAANGTYNVDCWACEAARSESVGALISDLVSAIEAELDDADQVTDTLERPNCVTVWTVRRVLMRFGGNPHRWPVPAEHCAECGHRAYDHGGSDDADLECGWPECGCALSRLEAMWGRDEAVDDAITSALWGEAVAAGEVP